MSANGLSQDPYDVIVVGGGPVGIVAAHLLGARGIRTLVLERDFEPYTLPRAIHLDHEVMRILQSAGLADRLLPELGIPTGSMHFGADLAAIRQFHRIVETDRLGWASDYFFYQPDLERALRAMLTERPSVEVLYGHMVETIEETRDLVTVEVRRTDGTSTTASARYVMGCDGARSTVRKGFETSLEDLGFDEPWIVVDAMVDGPVVLPRLSGNPVGVDMQKVMFIIADPARPTSVIPGVGRHRRWEFMMLPHERPGDFDDPARVAALIAPWIGESQFEILRCAVYRFRALIARRWNSDRLFLAGDSAHQTPPFFGQGLCHGIRDAANLTWKLDMVLHGEAPAGLLQTYQPEREPQVRQVIELSIRTGRYICTLDAEAAHKRDREMREIVARTIPSYVDIIPPLSAGVLGLEHGDPSPVGSRFIQPPMANGDGSRKLLDDHVGPGWKLFHDGSIDGGLTLPRYIEAIEITGQHARINNGALTDVTDEFAQWCRHYRCIGAIIRPDAYVYGTFASVDDAKQLVARLEMQIKDGSVATEMYRANPV